MHYILHKPFWGEVQPLQQTRLNCFEILQTWSGHLQGEAAFHFIHSKVGLGKSKHEMIGTVVFYQRH